MTDDRTKRLERIVIGARATTPALDPESLRADEWYDIIGQNLGTILTASLFGEDREDITITYPETWWDAFKERWLAWTGITIRRRTHRVRVAEIWTEIKAKGHGLMVDDQSRVWAVNDEGGCREQ